MGAMPSPLTSSQRSRIQRSTLAWFRAHRRELPWRANRDAYRIWVAEIMLQQTRIAVVGPYYGRFLKAFPSVHALARARPRDVLRAWAGLGYYSRARNLHRAARDIVTRHYGDFPREREEALALPGIGPYTAAAVLSIAYAVPLAALDGNIARVLARLGAVSGDLHTSQRWRKLAAAAQQLLAAYAPGDWNQALMELGETICTPRIPRCGLCPISRWCAARRRGLTDKIPTVRRKRPEVQVRIAAAVLRDPRGRTMLVRDPGAHEDVIFSRMWQFPAVEVTHEPAAELRSHLGAVLQTDAGSFELEPLREARHGVTFRNITLMPFLVRVPLLSKRPRTRIVPLGGLQHIPISSATRKIAAAAVT
jgi:A/G-specific adenine glycosylase